MVQQFTYKGPIPDGRKEMEKWQSLGKAALTDIKVRSYHSEIQGDLVKKLGNCVCY